jgi:hypothetical protein
VLCVLTAEAVALFSVVTPQLRSLLSEIRELSKKHPDGSVNKFKLGFVNEKLGEANSLLGERDRPLRTFGQFDVDSLPSNSDVVLILSQYVAALDRWQTARTYRDLVTLMWKTDPPIEVR